MKITKLLYTGLAALLLTACSESKEEYHYFNAATTGNVIYADQEVDTLFIMSTDSWDAKTTADWVSPNTASYKKTSEPMNLTKTPLAITPNNTGKTRGNYFEIKGYKRTFRKTIVQTSWLNIITPDPKYSGWEGGLNTITAIPSLTDVKAEFTIDAKNSDTKGKIVVNIFDRSATLTTDTPWITLGQTVLEHTNPLISEKFEVEFTMDANNSGAERKGVITITTANGIKTDVTVKQKG